MFIYAMIAAELVLLYVVFWYLFLRDPDPRRKIAGNTWGAYKNALPRYDKEVIVDDPARDDEPCSCEPEPAVRGFMVPHPRELVFDPRKNKYISVNQYNRSRTRLAIFLQSVDETLSKLNVKP